MTLTLRPPLYISGSQRSVWFFQEDTAGTAPGWPASLKSNPPTLISPPSDSPLYLGQTNSPAVQRPKGGALMFSIGSEVSNWGQPGGIGPHTITVNLEAGVGVATTVKNFLPCGGLTGMMGKADWALYINTDSTVDGVGWMDIYRYCKLIHASVALTLGDNGDVTSMVWTLTFLCLAGPQAGVVLTPALADLQAGVPLYGTNCSSVAVAGYELRRDLTTIQAALDITVVPRGRNNDLGDNVALSLAPVGLKPRKRIGAGSLGTSQGLPNAMLLGSAAARAWGDIVILLSNAAASSVGAGAIVERITLQNARAVEDSDEAIEQDADMSYGASFAFSDMIVAAA